MCRDRRKLTYYFQADRRIDFRELVRELFKIYKTRIWMCSVEEARGQELKNQAPSSVAAAMAIYNSARNTSKYNDENIEEDEDEFFEEEEFLPGSI